MARVNKSAPGQRTAERMRYLAARPSLFTAQAVELSGLSETTIKKAIATGALDSRKVGGSRLIRTDSLLAWIGAEAVAS